MKTYFALLALAATFGVAPQSRGQEAIPMPTEMAVESTLEPESLQEAPAPGPGDVPTEGELLPHAQFEPEPEALAPESLDGSAWDDTARYFDACPPLFESSGTWLRRGFWYGEFDYVLMTRTWDEFGRTLMFERGTGNLPQGGSSFFINNALNVLPDKPDAEGMARITLGRFLFRDSSNRDHVAELTWLGGANFKQEASLDAVTALTFNDLLQGPNRGFDGALFAQFGYLSALDSIEANYRVKRRMGRDRLELQPSGDWVRKATLTRHAEFLTGMRFINMRETFNFTASGPDASSGFNRIRADNDMLGTQIGGVFGLDSARWSLQASAKFGGYWNSMDLNSGFQVGTVTPVAQGVNNQNADGLSFVTEAELLAKWHLRPNVSLRAGMTLLYLESVALAPTQLSFIENSNQPINSGGAPVYIGSTFGLEIYR